MPRSAADRDNEGFVHFPRHDGHYEDSGEGGLIVHLYVLDHEEYQQRWENCCDDVPFWDSFVFTAAMHGWYQPRDAALQVQSGDDGRRVLLAMKLASTDWSGYHTHTGMFSASMADLTADGVALFDLLKRLYPGRRFVMQTTLDT